MLHGISRADHDEIKSRLERWDQRLKAREHLPFSIVYKTCSMSRLFSSPSTTLHHLIIVSTPASSIQSPPLPKMKSLIAMLSLACAVSAVTVPEGLLQRSAQAICNAKKGESCPGSGVFGCVRYLPLPPHQPEYSANFNPRRTTGATRYARYMPQHIDLPLINSEDVLL
jgi:hypothetical protein